MNFDKKQLRNTLLLLLGALIWGTAFVAQSVGSGYVGPYTFLAARSWLACAFLIVLVLLRRGKARKADPGVPFWINGRMLLRGGAFCGIALFAASAAQQIGIGTTSTAKADKRNVGWGIFSAFGEGVHRATRRPSLAPGEPKLWPAPSQNPPSPQRDADTFHEESHISLQVVTLCVPRHPWRRRAAPHGPFLQTPQGRSATTAEMTRTSAARSFTPCLLPPASRLACPPAFNTPTLHARCSRARRCNT